MSKMISVASGFQYSINIGYDLNNDEKIKNFIPTKSALNLLEDILMSTNANSTERARVLDTLSGRDGRLTKAGVAADASFEQAKATVDSKMGAAQATIDTLGKKMRIAIYVFAW